MYPSYLAARRMDDPVAGSPGVRVPCSGGEEAECSLVSRPPATGDIHSLLRYVSTYVRYVRMYCTLNGEGFNGGSLLVLGFPDEAESYS